MEQKQYRTRESFEDMLDNCNNGNWRDAAKIGVEFGRYANDLLKEYDDGGFLADGLADLVLLTEMITTERYRGELDI